MLEQGIKLAQDEKTWITVVKVVQPFDGDLNLTGIKNLNDVLDDGGTAALSEIKKTAEGRGRPGQDAAGSRATCRSGSWRSRKKRSATSSSWGRRKKKGILSRLFGDHIVEKVIDRAPCPVYVVAI